jgi:hypothetical protein
MFITNVIYPMEPEGGSTSTALVSFLFSSFPATYGAGKDVQRNETNAVEVEPPSGSIG